jgi:hypothetical protein
LQPEKEGDEALLEVVSAQIGDARVDGTVKDLMVAPGGFSQGRKGEELAAARGKKRGARVSAEASRWRFKGGEREEAGGGRTTTRWCGDAGQEPSRSLRI